MAGSALAEEQTRTVTGTVVIAKSSSAHRDALAESLRAELVAAGLTCRVIPLADLATVDPATCRNIVVLTDVPEWGKGKSVEKYLADKDASVTKKMIVATMANKASWKAPLKDVDAITGASKKEELPAQATAIRERILGESKPEARTNSTRSDPGATNPEPLQPHARKEKP
jgi:hypothetical protein